MLSATQYETAFDDLIKGTIQAADGTVYCYCLRSSGSGETHKMDLLVLGLNGSGEDPAAYTWDTGDHRVMPSSMVQNPVGNIILYTNDSFDPDTKWTETTLTGTKLECEFAEADVKVEAVEIQTYTPSSTATRLK